MATPAKITKSNLPVLALVGRVNVGKSTLFNRLTETNKAVVADVPGTTRTRNEGICLWRGKTFKIVDTGGLTFSDDIPLEKEIIHQTELALKEANVILFVVDLKAGLLPQEKELAKRLKKMVDKTVILVANKADKPSMINLIYEKEWKTLNFGEPFPVSAASGLNLGDLLDIVFSKFKKVLPKKFKEPKKTINISLIGRPNVGKSSLFNKLIGEDKVVVSEIAHTTREPHDVLVEYDKNNLVFVDTAGIRRKNKVGFGLEREGIHKSLDQIELSDIVLLVLDAGESIADQDQQLAGLLRQHTKSVIIIINKWDLSEENTDEFRNQVKKHVYAKFPHLRFAPIVFTSAKSGYKVQQIFPLIMQAWEARHTEIEAGDLRWFVEKAVKKHFPSRGKGVRHPVVKGFTQINVAPPIFELAVKARTSLHSSYIFYLENQLREKYNFFATPIIIKIKKTKRN